MAWSAGRYGAAVAPARRGVEVLGLAPRARVAPGVKLREDVLNKLLARHGGTPGLFAARLRMSAQYFERGGAPSSTALGDRAVSVEVAEHHGAALEAAGLDPVETEVLERDPRTS